MTYMLKERTQNLTTSSVNDDELEAILNKYGIVYDEESTFNDEMHTLNEQIFIQDLNDCIKLRESQTTKELIGSKKHK
jgi:hypothetical protein